MLKRWTRAGTGPAETPPAGPTQADPDIRQEIAWLKKAITGGNRELMPAAGGFHKAAERLKLLRQLPDGTPTTAQRRAAIDRYSIWSTTRLIGPEAAW